MNAGPDRTVRMLSGWLAVAVVFELVVLRTGTRTLIHIPGLGRFDISIGALSELGRFGYYLALVLVISTLIYVGWRSWARGTIAGRLVGGAAWSFIVIGLLGRFGVVPMATVTWLSLLLMVVVLVAGWSGARSIPVAFFVIASISASWSVLGQASGGGLSGPAVDTAVVVAEAGLILAGVSTPLLVRGRVTKPALVAGLVSVVVVAAGLSVGGSTLAILTLWNLGVPGWFAPIAHALALGGMVLTSWSAIADRDAITACGVLLILAGGVAPISTYQTALALTAVILLGFVGSETRRAGTPEEVGSEDGTLVPETGELVALS